LLFTLPPLGSEQVEAELVQTFALRRIGVIEEQTGVRCTRGGIPVTVSGGGYDHFA